MNEFKLALFGLVLVALTIGVAADQKIRVIGTGSEEVTAIGDGYRLALERVVTLELRSRSKIDKLRLVQDIVELNARGYVSDHKIIAIERHNGLYKVTMDVWVRESLLADVGRWCQSFDRTILVVAKLDDHPAIPAYVIKKTMGRLASAVRTYLIDQGAKVFYKEARAKNIAEIDNLIAVEDSESFGDKLLYYPDYTLVLSLDIVAMPSSIPGMSTFAFEARLIGHLTQVAIQLNEINDDSQQEVPTSYRDNHSFLRSVFSKHAERIGRTLAHQSFCQLYRQVVEFHNHHIFFVGLRGYSSLEIVRIRNKMSRLPGVAIKRFNASTVGKTKLAAARLSYNPGTPSPGGELLARIYRMLYEMKLQPGNGYRQIGEQLVFLK